MDTLDIVKTMPRNSYKDFMIPWPKSFSNEKIENRRKRMEWNVW
jgi:hypothetical protein